MSFLALTAIPTVPEADGIARYGPASSCSPSTGFVEYHSAETLFLRYVPLAQVNQVFWQPTRAIRACLTYYYTSAFKPSKRKLSTQEVCVGCGLTSAYPCVFA